MLPLPLQKVICSVPRSRLKFELVRILGSALHAMLLECSRPPAQGYINRHGDDSVNRLEPIHQAFKYCELVRMVINESVDLAASLCNGLVWTK